MTRTTVQPRHRQKPQHRKRKAFASRLPLGSAELNNLLSDRVMRGRCLECGAPRNQHYCDACRARFPITTEINGPVDDWQYRVVQVRPAYESPAFRAMRVGVFERAGQEEQWLGCADTFEQAKRFCVIRARKKGYDIS